MRQINVEGNELALKNSNGDIVIVPKKDRDKVQKLISDKCWDCVDNYVSGLPTMSDYAQDGTVVPSDIDPITGSPYSKKIVRVREKDNIKEYDVNSAEYKKLYHSDKLKNYRFDTKSKVYEPLPEPDPNKEKSDFWKANNSIPAAVGKIFDPYGVSSYPDVYKAWSDGKIDYHDVVEPLGALPILGEVPKIFKLTKAITNADKAAKAVAGAGKMASKVEKAIPNTLEYMGELNKYLPRKSPALDILGKTGQAINKSSDNVSKYVTDQLSDVFSTKGGFTTLKGLTKADKINTAVHVLNTANLGADVTGVVKAVNDNQQQVGGTWDKVKAIANPFNWGVDDYSSLQDKGKAFAAARKDGKKEFMFNNQRYSTELDIQKGVEDYTPIGTRNQAFGAARKDGLDQFVYKNNVYNTRRDDDDLSVIGGDSYEQSPRAINNYLKTKYPELVKLLNRGKGIKGIGFMAKDEPNAERANYTADRNRIHVGSTATPNNNRFISDLIAEIAHNKDKGLDHPDAHIMRGEELKYGEEIYNMPGSTEYNAHRLYEPGIAMTAYGNLNPKDIKRIQKHLKVKEDGYFGEETYKALVKKYKSEPDFQNELNYSEWKKKNDNGEYPLSDDYLPRLYLGRLSQDVPIKNVDHFEYSTPYGGLYRKDAVVNIDPEDPSTFNARTLQRTLADRNYPLPKSITKDDEFDGVYGDETKKALIDFQERVRKESKQLIKKKK